MNKWAHMWERGADNASLTWEDGNDSLSIIYPLSCHHRKTKAVVLFPSTVQMVLTVLWWHVGVYMRETDVQRDVCPHLKGERGGMFQILYGDDEEEMMIRALSDDFID